MSSKLSVLCDAREVGLKEDEIIDVRRGALLHAVGMNIAFANLAYLQDSPNWGKIRSVDPLAVPPSSW